MPQAHRIPHSLMGRVRVRIFTSSPLAAGGQAFGIPAAGLHAITKALGKRQRRHDRAAMPANVSSRHFRPWPVGPASQQKRNSIPGRPASLPAVGQMRHRGRSRQGIAHSPHDRLQPPPPHADPSRRPDRQKQCYALPWSASRHEDRPLGRPPHSNADSAGRTTRHPSVPKEHVILPGCDMIGKGGDPRRRRPP